MNKAQNIAILGAGIMGLCAGRALAHHHHITIYDPKGFPADNASPNASKVAGGMLAPYSEIEHMDMRWVEAGLHGIELWKNTNLDTGFAQNGSLLLAHEDDRYILERFAAHLPQQQNTRKAPQELEPTLSSKLTSGLLLEQEAHLNPHKTMQALCDDLKNSGVKFETKSAAPEDLQSKYDSIIDCRGIAADDQDLRGVKGEILIVRNTEFTLSRPVRLMHPRYPLYIVPRGEGIFMIGATQIESEDAEHVSLRSSMELMSALYTLSPSFAEAEIIELRAGLRPSYPDNLPRIKINETVISCNGLFRHGYLLAPVMAQCVADHLAQRENQYISLFYDGERNESHNQRRAEELRGAA